MVLHAQVCGRVGSRPIILKKTLAMETLAGVFAFYLLSSATILFLLSFRPISWTFQMIAEPQANG